MQIVLQQGFHFEFTIQRIELTVSLLSASRFQKELFLFLIFDLLLVVLASTLKKNKYRNKVSTQQLVRGHLMRVKQFNHPVYCALCHGFIW